MSKHESIGQPMPNANRKSGRQLKSGKVMTLLAGLGIEVCLNLKGKTQQRPCAKADCPRRVNRLTFWRRPDEVILDTLYRAQKIYFNRRKQLHPDANLNATEHDRNLRALQFGHLQEAWKRISKIFKLHGYEL